MTDKLSMFIPLVKVDEKKREVWGRATQEILDGHDEIFDYTSSVPNFKKWSDMFAKRTGGKSKGNIREMHQPVASGKVIAIDFNDGEKAIDIGTYISDDGSWQKVLDGTLTGFSIGGDYEKRWMDSGNPGKTRYTANPHEISLVDMPAVPTAVFELIRADGQTELRKFAKYQTPELADMEKVESEVVLKIEEIQAAPEIIKQEEAGEVAKEDGAGEVAKSHLLEPGKEAEDVKIVSGTTEGALPSKQAEIEEVLSGAEVTTITPSGAGVPSMADSRNREISTGQVDIPVTKTTDTGELEQIIKQLSERIEKKVQALEQRDNEIEKVTAVLKLRSSRVGIARRESEPLTAPNGFPTDWSVYADPVNWKFPVTKGQAVASLMRYNSHQQMQKYSPREWNIIGRRMARLASDTFGVTYKFDPTSKKVELIKENKIMSNPLLNKADAMGLLREASAQINNACAMIGSDPSAAKDLLMQVMAAMDVAGDMSAANPASGASPSLGSASSSVANAQPAGEIANVAGEGELANAAGTTTTSTATATKTESTPSYEKALEEAMAKALAPVLETMQKQAEEIAQMKKAQEHPATEPPAGDLSAILQNMHEDENPVLKAMNEGDLRKAFEAVGNNPNRLFEQVNDLAVRQLALSGINVAKFGIFPSDEPVLGKPN